MAQETLAFTPIATKLRIPVPQSASLRRARLNRLLNRATEHKLTVVAAPAGFGKTTLLGEWSQTSKWPVAWVSLDEADNDPARFWSYVVVALDKLDARVGENVLPFVHAANPSPLENLIPTLVNTVTAIADHFVLVLDDYYRIESEAVHQGVSYLLDYLPDNMHVVIASRHTPPLPLARWRAQGQLFELGVAHLRFSQSEIERLFTDILSLDLGADDLVALQTRTEGWAVGLRLAALAMQQPSQTSAEAFQGDHHYVVEYLGTEVMEQLPPETRAFLLKTSILDTLSPALCDAVCFGGTEISGCTESQSLLDELCRRQLFITALSGKGQYRYHHLFAEFLREQLQRDPLLDAPSVHRRAFRWYQAQGDLEQAISHALAAGDVDGAVMCIEDTAREYLMRGEFVTLIKWFGALPEPLVRQHPSFCLIYAWALTNTGQIDAARGYLDHLESNPPVGPESNALLGEAATVRARIATVYGEAESKIAFSQRALSLLPAEALVLRSDAYLELSFALLDKGNFEAAQKTFEKAIDLSRETGNQRTAMMALYYLGDTHMVRGQFQRAAQWYQQGLRWGRMDRPAGTVSPPTCWPLAGFGQLLYEWNDLEEAIHHLERAVALAQQSGEVKVLIYPRLTLARVLQAQGQFDQALAVLDDAAQVAEQMAHTDFVQQVDLARLGIWFSSGQANRAVNWLQQHGISVQNDNLSHHQWAMLACRHTYLDGRVDTSVLSRVIAFFQTECRSAKEAGRYLHVVQHAARLAILHDTLAQGAQARDWLSQAIALGEPMGLVRTFVDYGPPMNDLLRGLAARRGRAPYLNKVLAAFQPSTPTQLRSPTQPTLPLASQVEPLRPREIEVLHHVADGRSNKEIADEMIMAVSTVKWYLRNIYEKLHVNRRTQALARARKLNLI